MLWLLRHQQLDARVDRIALEVECAHFEFAGGEEVHAGIVCEGPCLSGRRGKRDRCRTAREPNNVNTRGEGLGFDGLAAAVVAPDVFEGCGSEAFGELGKPLDLPGQRPAVAMGEFSSRCAPERESVGSTGVLTSSAWMPRTLVFSQCLADASSCSFVCGIGAGSGASAAAAMRTACSRL